MLLDTLKYHRIILATGSPRRQQLLGSLGIEFEVFTGCSTDESYPSGLKGDEIALFLARKKSLSYPVELNENEILITADTIVCQDGEVLHKPESEADAVEILQKLAGSSHHVFTGVCLRNTIKEKGFVSQTEVRFGMLSDEEINYYIQTYKPYDKAGAYGIQEWIGYIGVEEINGSYFNVMGLPVQLLYRNLEKFIN
ncbi:MAG: Maf family nucleotide pyrophosphatase [Bacteroidales bacterium]|nr:Maf family nucleotide pyrophosphatase [Bacteroidales bacterium]